MASSRSFAGRRRPTRRPMRSPSWRATSARRLRSRRLPGFVSNRILMPFVNEAVWALHEGVAEPEAIDTIAKLGFAHPMVPLALADLIGLDTCVAIMEVLRDGLGNDRYEPCPAPASTSRPAAWAASPARASTATTDFRPGTPSRLILAAPCGDLHRDRKLVDDAARTRRTMTIAHAPPTPYSWPFGVGGCPEPSRQPSESEGGHPRVCRIE